MTEDANDGRPWPVDPPPPPTTEGPVPVPELELGDSVETFLADFAPAGNGHTNGQSNGHGSLVVSDEDRTAYGVLLDRAAERGLLSESEYRFRLGELAAATSLDEMRRLVTELPAFELPPPTPRGRRAGGRVPATALGVPLVAGSTARRRGVPWAVLAVMVAVLIVALLFFAVYAEHIVHQRDNTGVVAWPAAVPAVPASSVVSAGI